MEFGSMFVTSFN